MSVATPKTIAERIDRLMWLAHKVARKYARKGEAEFDDYLQVCMVATLKARDHYDPNRGEAAFEHYAHVAMSRDAKRYYMSAARVVPIPEWTSALRAANRDPMPPKAFSLDAPVGTDDGESLHNFIGKTTIDEALETRSEARYVLSLLTDTEREFLERVIMSEELSGSRLADEWKVPHRTANALGEDAIKRVRKLCHAY